MAELEADPEWRAAEARREALLAEQEAAYAEAEAPLVAALAGAGLEVESVWDLVNRDDDGYADVVTVLVEHLQDESYPDRVREGIARSLSFRKAAPAWPVIAGLYRSTTDSFGLQQGLAVAMAGTVTDETVDELVAEARLRNLLGVSRLATRRSGRDTERRPGRHSAKNTAGSRQDTHRWREPMASLGRQQQPVVATPMCCTPKNAPYAIAVR